MVRGLTPPESSLAREVFGGTLDAARVRLHGRAYLPVQARGVAMAPNGHIYFHAGDYRADFTESVIHAAWLVHELTHVWQHQQGVPVRMRGLLEQLSRAWGRDPYAYGRVDRARPFGGYGLEQQATMVEDRFRLSRGLPALHGAGAMADYHAVIPFP